MTEDEVLAGPNWTGDLIGREVNPFELRELIEEIMSPSLLDEYEKKYIELTTTV